MFLRNFDKWDSWYFKNSISCSLFLVSTSLLSLFLFSIASILDFNSITLFSSFVFLDSRSSIFLSKSALPCSACNYFLIAKVTELIIKIENKIILPLIKCLIGGDCHLYFISDSQKKETSFRFAQSNLSNDFIKTLREELFSDRAYSTFSSLSLHQLLIKHLSQSSYVNSGSWLMTNVLNIVFCCKIFKN